MCKFINKAVWITFCLVFVFSGTVAANGIIDWQTGHAEAYGIGISPPQAATPAQARILAERAAKVEAYAQLLNLINSIKINNTDTIKTVTDANNSARIKLEGIIKGAQVVDRQSLCEGFFCLVIVRAPLYGVSGVQGAVTAFSQAAESLNTATASNN